MLFYAVPFNTNVTDLYSLTIYILFPICILIFSLGFVYRVSKLFLASRRKKWIGARANVGLKTLALGLINVFLYPQLFSLFKDRRNFVLGLFGVHILGLIPLIFLLGQHMAFYSYYIPIYSVLWPLSIPISPATGSLPLFQYLEPASPTLQSFGGTIWGPLTIILNGDVLTAIAMIAIGIKLGERVYMVLKEDHRPSDLILYLHLIAILSTGALAAHHTTFFQGYSVIVYRTVLSLHIMLAGLFLALLPFTKYWHFVFGMYFGKIIEWIDRTWMRGAALEGGRLVPPRRRAETE